MTTMYLATKTVIGSYALAKGSVDKAAIAKTIKDTDQRIGVDVVKGEHYEKGKFPPNIFKDLHQRGVLVESEPVNIETIAQVTGGKALEQNTEVSMGAPE